MSTTPKIKITKDSTHTCVKLGINVALKLKNSKKKTKVTTTNNKYKDILVIEKSRKSAILKKAKLTTSNFSIGENIKSKKMERNIYLQFLFWPSIYYYTCDFLKKKNPTSLTSVLRLKNKKNN